VKKLAGRKLRDSKLFSFSYFRKINVIFTILILMFYPFSPRNHEPQRKLHVTEDFVAQTMADLYISNPKAKVARR
jgi:hypothetical protein